MIESYGVPCGQSTVRVACSRDAAAVAALHTTAIGEGFLSALGEPFLRRLYTRIVKSDHAFLLVAGSPNGAGAEGGVVGFVAGCGSTGRLYREFLLKDGLAVAVSSGARLVRSVPRVIETLRYGTSRRGAREAKQAAESELLALAVAQGARDAGIGTKLVTGFLATAAADGAATARVVVGADNRRAIALYDRTGFNEVSELELHRGTVSLLMRAELSHHGL